MLLHSKRVVFNVIFFICSCSYNCGPKAVNRRKRTVIKSNCTGRLCKNITRYEWTLFQLDSADVSGSWKEDSDLDYNNPDLELISKLKENTSYKIKGSIEVMKGKIKKKYSSFNEITFQTMSPLITPNDRCKVTPNEGFALETNFIIDCDGWQDQYANLTYTFRYVSL